MIAYSLIAFCAFLVFVVRPKWGVYTFSFLIPLERAFVIGDVGAGTSLIKFVGYALVGSWLIHSALSPQNLTRIKDNRILPPLISITLLCLFSIIWSTVPSSPFKPIRIFVTGILLVITISSLIHTKAEFKHCIFLFSPFKSQSNVYPHRL